MDVFFQPSHGGRPFAVEVGYFDSVAEIKQKIQKDCGIPVDKQVLVFNGKVLNDDLNVHSSDILDRSCITLIVADHISDNHANGNGSNGTNGVSDASNHTTANHVLTVKPPPPDEEEEEELPPAEVREPAPAAGKKMKVLVLTKCGTRKVAVDVSPAEKVGQLRKELQKVGQHLELNLPQEGYFFIYKQNVMDDDRSFRWHHVGNGDTIEIFNGSISGGT